MMCGSLSVVLAKPADYLDAFERCCEDNSMKGVRFSFTDFLQFMFLERLSAIPSSPARFLFFRLLLFL